MCVYIYMCVCSVVAEYYRIYIKSNEIGKCENSMILYTM